MMGTANEIDPLEKNVRRDAGSSRATDPGLQADKTEDGDRGLVLVVDEEPTIVELVAEYLGIQGFAVVTARSGIEALTQLETERPDAVLLDMRMPEMDGIETLKRIMAGDSGARVLMVSGNDDVQLMKKAITLGAFDYLLKPIDFGYLSRALDQMIRSRTRIGPDEAGSAATPPASDSVSAYQLALEVFRAVRTMSPGASRSVGSLIEDTALRLVQEGPGAERRTVLRLLGEIRTLLRFAMDLGDITDDLHRHLESQIVRARRGLGLS